MTAHLPHDAAPIAPLPDTDDGVVRSRTGRLARVARLEPRMRILLFSLVLAAVGGVLLLLTPGTTLTPSRSWDPTLFGLAAAFALTEATALHVEIRKESHSLSLSALPMMLGLLFVSPVTLVAAHLLGGAPVIRWVRHSDWLKTLWNSSLFVTEVSLAALLLRSVLGTDLPSDAVEWLIPLGAAMVAELVSLLAVPSVIMVFDARFRLHLFRDVGRSQLLAALAATFGVAAVAASVEHPAMLSFSIVPIIGLGLLLRSTGHLSQRHKDLQQLHNFTRSIANERGARTLDIGLVELAKIMRSQTAGLLMIGDDPDERSTLRIVRDDVFVDADAGPVADLMRRLLEPDAVIEFAAGDPRPEVRHLLQTLGARRIVAAEVLGNVNRCGVLFVADRVGMRSDFNADELRLFGSLTNTLSARLSNDLLVERLETQARHDALTGLPNRLSFEVALTAALSDPHRHGVVVMIDLDRFKEINDSLGHETGDRLLVEIADRLRACSRANDMVARFGGDEFAMLLVFPDDVPTASAERLEHFHSLLTSKADVDGITFEVGASLGVAEWPAHGTDSATLLHRADTAMYEAKRNQLGVVRYTSELDADAPRRRDLYLSTGAAIDDDALYIELQPKVSLIDGRITGAEALVRWTHPVHGEIQPEEFVPLMIQAGLIGQVTRSVIRQAAHVVLQCRAVGLSIPIAVNLTPRDLLDPDLVDDIVAIWIDAGASLGDLRVEVTEHSMVVDFETSIAALNRLRAHGARVAIDDFGTGYSSMQHLHRLPVDELKIDRSFVDRVTTDDSAVAIVKASLRLAGELGLSTVAEGVEDRRSLEVVRRLGCSQIQGFLISRPLETCDLITWARAWDPSSVCRPDAEVTPPAGSVSAARRHRPALSRR